MFSSPSLQQVAGVRCGRLFYDRPCEELAKALLGCALVRVCGGEECRGVVVETEAYLGKEDKAAHSYRGRRTDRNGATFMEPGTAYVYSVYGMHRCFNVSSRGEGCAVLVRALEPMGGLEGMQSRRGARPRGRDLCNGPAKLCQAMGIGKECDKVDLVTSGGVWLEEGGGEGGEGAVVSVPRIGIEYAEEWTQRPLRFYIKGNKFVSRK